MSLIQQDVDRSNKTYYEVGSLTVHSKAIFIGNESHSIKQMTSVRIVEYPPNRQFQFLLGCLIGFLLSLLIMTVVTQIINEPIAWILFGGAGAIIGAVRGFNLRFSDDKDFVKRVTSVRLVQIPSEGFEDTIFSALVGLAPVLLIMLVLSLIASDADGVGLFVLGICTFAVGVYGYCAGQSEYAVQLQWSSSASREIRFNSKSRATEVAQAILLAMTENQ